MLSVWWLRKFAMVEVWVWLSDSVLRLTRPSIGPTSPLTQLCRDEVHHIAAQTVSILGNYVHLNEASVSPSFSHLSRVRTRSELSVSMRWVQ